MGYVTEKEMLRCRPLLVGSVPPRFPLHQLKVQPVILQAQPLVLRVQQHQLLSQKPERSSAFPAKYDRSIEAGWWVDGGWMGGWWMVGGT